MRRFDWDTLRNDRNREERGLSFAFAALIFSGDTVEWLDSRQDYGEVRVRAVGATSGVILHVVSPTEVTCVVSYRFGSHRK